MANLTDVIISDASEDSGNPEAARKALTEAVTATVDTSSSNSTTTTEADDGLPSKFKGKSAREIAEAYANLESRLGTMANDLGVQRQLTDRLLDMKRENDLSRNGGGKTERQKPAPVTTNELLDRPQETLERVVSDRVSSVEESTSARIAQLEAELLKTKFESRHPTYQTTVQDPDFIAWVKASPLRLRAAGVANAGNWQVADELLTEYKGHQNATSSNTTTQSDRTNHVEEARRASFTSSGNASGTDGKAKQGGIVYKRSDLIALRISDPEAYYDEAFQEKIQAAYAEGRVR